MRDVVLGGDGTDIGAVTPCHALLPVLVAMALGRRTDRLRVVWPLTVAGTLLLVLSPAAIAVADSLAVIFIAAPFLDLGHLLVLVSAQAAAAGVP